ncbi:MULTISPECIES: hypothetical protein [unclassified Bartonella]|uniref:hypothetical protein n=1 Tax=unclassified Bartonella TaxID=2645622 RepID=UPI0035CF2DB6
MSNDVMFWLLLGFFCFFALALIFIYKGAKRRSVTEWVFWRWVVFYGVVASYLGFVYVGVGRRAVDGELLLKGAVFSCIFATVLGLVHLGFGASGRQEYACCLASVLKGGHVLLHDGLYPVVCCCGCQRYG